MDKACTNHKCIQLGHTHVHVCTRVHMKAHACSESTYVHDTHDTRVALNLCCVELVSDL